MSLNNLGWLLLLQGKYDEAEPLHRRALAIREKVLGPEHPEVAASLNNVARDLSARGEYGEAEPLFLRAATIMEKARDPRAARVRENLAALYRARLSLSAR
jgi:Flp pilus assembly protein TadD